MYPAVIIRPFLILCGLFSSAAFAEVRIDTTQFTRDKGYKRARFESHSTGWMGLDRQWVQRIYVGKTESDVQVWFERMQSQYYKHKLEVVEGDWTEGLGNRELLMVRVGQLGLLCHGSNPRPCIAKLMRLQMETHSTCPVLKGTPMLEQGWLLPYQLGTCNIHFTGGSPMYTEDGVLFAQLPDSIVVYNQFAESWKYIRDADQFTLIQHMESSVLPEQSQP